LAQLESSKEAFMREKNKGQKGEVQTETGEALKGPKPLSLEKLQQQDDGPTMKQQGDDRTPDKPGQRQKTEGGAGSPQTSDLEPEKQGGIGGP
jgi:hypothetical protein